MNIREGQRVGALVILLVALAVYGGSWFHARFPAPHPPLPWGHQGPRTVAVDIAGLRGADGIYFLPEASVFSGLSQITGAAAMAPTDGPASPGPPSSGAFRVSAEGGRLGITEMPAAKRLALGLPIDVNGATAEDLMLVPGIGEKTAARIVQFRQSRGGFETLSELTGIPGIKGKKLRSLEKYLTVEPTSGKETPPLIPAGGAGAGTRR